MREIKFRAWDKKEIYYNTYNSESNKMIYGITLSDVKIHTSLEHFEIMQYTGLKDKNDVEIYEGDVVKIPNPLYKNYPDEKEHAIVTIKSNKGLNISWSPFTAYGHCTQARFIEVIGNIYENPELLKELNK